MTSHRRHLLLNDIGNASNASDREDEPWQTALTSARSNHDSSGARAGRNIMYTVGNCRSMYELEPLKKTIYVFLLTRPYPCPHDSPRVVFLMLYDHVLLHLCWINTLTYIFRN